MGRTVEQRYSNIAVIFHWLIALLIISLLGIGKYMTSLDETDPARYVLTQWHKTFGVLVLLLAVLRLLWRLTHKPPPSPSSLPHWQHVIANGVHHLLYLLMFALPITGWVMVSASPLNIDTLLFGIIPWPHIAPIAEAANREAIAHNFHEYHELASHVLILLFLAHAGAALKHHFIDKDTILSRMSPDLTIPSFRNAFLVTVLLIGAASAGLLWYSNANQSAALVSAGDSDVSFIADVAGEQTPGIFTETTVEALIDESSPANSTIKATVQTGSASGNNYQVIGSLPEPEWFGSEAYPAAQFESTQIEAGTEPSTLNVTGNLTIKETTLPISFPMTLTTEDNKRLARGQFTVDRRTFNIGMESQKNDDMVGFAVTVKFRFDITSPDG